LVLAAIALLEMSTQYFGAADFDRPHGPELLFGQGLGLAILPSVPPEDIGYFHSRSIHD
jgi:hypothetical protein